MIEVCKGLFIGSESDYERDVRLRRGWHVVHACKEPYHRLFVGYKGRGCPKDSPEYLWALRGGRLALNLVDGDDPQWVPDGAVDAALEHVSRWLEEGPVLLHCNRGASRSPVIGMLWMRSRGLLPEDFAAAEERFRTLYPPYAPARGMRLYAMGRWEILQGPPSAPRP